MKNIFRILFLTLCGAHFAHADFARGSQTIAILGGAGGSSEQYDFRGPEDRPITGSGAAWGAQYLYYLSPSIAIGADLNVSYNGSRRDDDQIADIDTTARSKAVTEMIIARLAYPRGRVRPYLFAGLGAHQSSFFLSGKPFPGTTWSNGGTDSRMLIDEHDTSLALAGGIGLDVFLTESLFLGTELRSTTLGGTKPDISPAGQALGLTLKHRHGASEGNIFFKLGWKFGA